MKNQSPAARLRRRARWCAAAAARLDTYAATIREPAAGWQVMLAATQLLERSHAYRDAARIIEAATPPPQFPLANRFTVGERCLRPGRSGSYPDPSRDRWGHIARIDQTVILTTRETLVVAFDDGETRGINPDVIAHGAAYAARDPKLVAP